jgi:hypothetical protein
MHYSRAQLSGKGGSHVFDAVQSLMTLLMFPGNTYPGLHDALTLVPYVVVVGGLRVAYVTFNGGHLTTVLTTV